MRVRSITAVFLLSMITITGCGKKDPLAGLPDATGTAEQVATETTGYYHGKVVAVTGQVERVNGSVVYLRPGVECYMKEGDRPAPGTTVTIQGLCLRGDRGETIDGAVLKSR